MKFPAGMRPAPLRASNLARGVFGAALKEIACAPECGSAAQCPRHGACFYSKFFDPVWPEGPSGYRSAPRPFVLRWRELEGKHEALLKLLLFELEPRFEVLERALRALTSKLHGAELLTIEQGERQALPVEAEPGPGRLRIRFITPTEWKSGSGVTDQPLFEPLMARLAERVWALGRLYQEWPANHSPAHLIANASEVRLERFDWRRQEDVRRSARSGQRHAVGGFLGWADYAGAVGPFLGLLEIGKYVGLGRHTVWGQGEIGVEFTPDGPERGLSRRHDAHPPA